MSGSSEAVQGVDIRIPQEGKQKRGRSKSRDTMADFNARLARVELAVAERQDMSMEWDQRIEGLEGELREEMQGALNVLAERNSVQGEEIKDSLLRELASLKGENQALRDELARVVSQSEAQMAELKGELALLKMALAHGVPNASPTPIAPTRVDVPRPKAFKGVRNAKEIDNFLWSLEQYFKAASIEGDARRIDNATLYLEDTAMVWWRRRCGDIQRGNCTINTWDEFKRELKRQFYPENAEQEARAKLRRLTHKGSIRDYVKDFSEVILEIPDYPDKEALFAFMDGLQSWAKLELQRRGVQDLASAIATAESLIEFKSPKPIEDAMSNDDFGGGDHKAEGKERSKPREAKLGNHKSGYREPLKCFLCEGPHMARDCPKKHRLSALIEEREEEPRHPREEVPRHEAKLGSMQILGALRVEEETLKPAWGGRMYVQAKLNKGDVQALVDTGASHNFLEEKEARRLGVRYEGERGMLKAVNSKPRPIHGVARGVELSIGDWQGTLDFSIIDMDDCRMVLGMDFMKKAEVVLVPFQNQMVLHDDDKYSYIVETTMAHDRGQALSSLRLVKVQQGKGHHRQQRGKAHGSGTRKNSSASKGESSRGKVPIPKAATHGRDVGRRRGSKGRGNNEASWEHGLARRKSKGKGRACHEDATRTSRS